MSALLRANRPSSLPQARARRADARGRWPPAWRAQPWRKGEGEPPAESPKYTVVLRSGLLTSRRTTSARLHHATTAYRSKMSTIESTKMAQNFPRSFCFSIFFIISSACFILLLV